MTESEQNNNRTYQPVETHWFWLSPDQCWKPFSRIDSTALENAYQEMESDVSGATSKIVPTDGGRYDVRVAERLRVPVYWDGVASKVRRCSWFFRRSLETQYIPYEEDMALKLEEQFILGNKIKLADPNNILDFLIDPSSPTTRPENVLPYFVVRGLEGIRISEGETSVIDHLIFMVHGIGAFCDIRFRDVIPAVNDFRSNSNDLLNSHFSCAKKQGKIGRVEYLPVAWHSLLHKSTGLDNRMNLITLPSVPKIRKFANDTILDVLYYFSPTYKQTIITWVADELNRQYGLFMERNPSFSGQVSVVGHSLGTVILFDLLKNQPRRHQTQSTNDTFHSSSTAMGDLVTYTHRLSYAVTCPSITYPKLNFSPAAFFALGSPIALFITVMDVSMDADYVLPDCPNFFNIFHPFDPVAYRFEPLIDPISASSHPAVLVPHYMRGGRRLHLKMQDNLKSCLHLLRSNLRRLFGVLWSNGSKNAITGSTGLAPINAGKLNGGKRIDYVLQEAPLESINEYFFSVSSHLMYWDSRDAMLLILKEIYNLVDISPDDMK